MEREGDARLRRFQHGEEARDDAQEGGFVEIDGGGDVHGGILDTKQNKNIN